MTLQQFYISEKNFSTEELLAFKEKHGYEIREIDYASSSGEIDFSDLDEKTFLLERGYPKILERFFA